MYHVYLRNKSLQYLGLIRKASQNHCREEAQSSTAKTALGLARLDKKDIKYCINAKY